MAKEEQVREVKRRHAPDLLKRPGVNGVGVEKDESGQFYLALHVEADNPQAQQGLPQEIDGVPVKVVQSGPFRAQS